MRNIPLKNYIVLLLISIITILLTFYLRNIYQNQKEYENNNNARMGFLQTIKEDEISSFITENRDFILYVSNASDENLKDYELNLKNEIIDRDYTKSFIYLNVDSISLESLNEYLPDSVNVIEIPNIIIVRDGKIKNIYYPSSTGFNAEETISYLENNFDGEE